MTTALSDLVSARTKYLPRICAWSHDERRRHHDADNGMKNVHMPREQLFAPKESSFSMSLNYFDIVSQTKTILDTLEGSRIDDPWNIDGNRVLSDSWSRSSIFRVLNKRPLRGDSSVHVRLTNISSHIETRNDLARSVVIIFPNVLRRKQATMGDGNPRTQAARQMRKNTIFFQTTSKSLTPLFRTPERSWRFQWDTLCHALRKRASRMPSQRRR